MFSLPEEMIVCILAHVEPRDLQALQCLTRLDLLRLYRHSQKYILLNKTERRAFEEFHANFFFTNLHKRQHVPGLVLRRLFTPNNYIGVSLLQRTTCVGENEQGRALLCMYKHTTMQRTTLPWSTFLALTVYAKYGQLEQLALLTEEKELAIALVKHGRPKHVQTILSAYVPATPEMVMCMLHFSLPLLPQTLNPALFTQQVCDYWILRAMPGCSWVVNNLPPGISVHFLLACNPHLFFKLALKKTITRFHLVARREKYTRAFPYFFSALVQHRKRCNLKLHDLMALSTLHIRQHGVIDYLTVRNKILLRSKLFQPSFEILKQGAMVGDTFFNFWVDKLRCITLSEKNELKRIAATAPPVRHRRFLPYIFSDIPDQDMTSLGNLITGLARNTVTYISCGPRLCPACSNK